MLKMWTMLNDSSILLYFYKEQLHASWEIYAHRNISGTFFFPSVGAYKTYGETVLVVEMVFHFSPQFLFETLFTAINI
jgi:hypothetical protein